MSRATLILLLLCAAVFAAVACVAYGVFQAVPHLEDEHANLFAAQVFASGKLYVPSPPRLGEFFVPFVIEWEGRRISKYPPGFSLVLALGVLARKPWLVNPLLGTLGLLATFALGRALFPEERDKRTALLAAILAATSPMFLGLSSTLLSHALSLFLLTVFAWALIRSTLYTPHSTPYALVAGLALGWAAITRPLTALVYAVPFGLWAVWQTIRGQKGAKSLVVMALTAGAVTALLPLYQWAMTGDPWVNLYATWWPYDTIGYGPGHGVLPEGHTATSAFNNAYVDLLALRTDLHGWPGLSWILLVPGLLMLPRDKRDAALLIPIVTLIVTYSFYWVRGSGVYGPRYWYEAVPFLWLLSARGLVKVWDWTQSRRAFRVCASIGLAALIALNVMMTIPAQFGLWRGLYGITNAPWLAVQQANLHHALVIVRGQSVKDYEAVSWANSPTLDSDIVFAREMDTGIAHLIEQYSGRSIYLLEGTQLTLIRK